MRLKITYFSEDNIHKHIFSNVIHWYYYDTCLIIKFKDDEIKINNVILLNAETWVLKD